MAAHKGRSVTFTWGGVAVAGVREKGITLNGEAIDITSDENNGWRTLLALSAEDQVDIALSGVTKEDTFIKDWFQGNRQKSVVITYPTGQSFTGTFMLVGTGDTAPYNDATAFEATLQSSGVVTYTPAP